MKAGSKEVQFLAYVYPDLVKVKVRGKVHTYLTSEYWARRAIIALRYGGGWVGVNILKRNGKEVSRDG